MHGVIRSKRKKLHPKMQPVTWVFSASAKWLTAWGKAVMSNRFEESMGVKPTCACVSMHYQGGMLPDQHFQLGRSAIVSEAILDQTAMKCDKSWQGEWESSSTSKCNNRTVSFIVCKATKPENSLLHCMLGNKTREQSPLMYARQQNPRLVSFNVCKAKKPPRIQ